MGDTVADTEKMEVSRSSEKIDMTLDEIIELNKKEQKAMSGAQRIKNKRMANRNSILKKLHRDGQQRFPFKRGAYQIQQGPYRPRFFRPYRQGFYGKRPNNFRKTPPSTDGVSPLNRKPWSTKDTEPGGHAGMKTQPWLNRKFYRPYRAPQPYGGRRFQHSEQNQAQGKTRPFTLNRTFLPRKMNDRFGKYHKVRSWRTAPSTGSILTVSVPNTKSAAEPTAKVKQSPVTDVSPETGAGLVTEPKGIPLRFNFKAVANQTGVSLNDRFTGLKIRGGTGHRPWRGRGRGRMVILQ
ncbi:UAP56-interacting factor isoform X2 [Conger conger]|uniref:UAP56-interacting factor isoform X2 n=1 Tax=Conger conger TaxID=82655 RepID=UPI002A5AB6B6|nr:UAP56-interacting factor isoform X2 [Conger conger]